MCHLESTVSQGDTLFSMTIFQCLMSSLPKWATTLVASPHLELSSFNLLTYNLVTHVQLNHVIMFAFNSAVLSSVGMCVYMVALFFSANVSITTRKVALV